MSTLNRYYEHELGHLRQLAGEFARRNPALAPLLGVGDSAADPDVERMLEGVAFLTGLLRQRIDDEFPEFIQELAQLLFPHYLRPLPCMTLMQFEPRGKMSNATLIPAGTEVASVPVDGSQTRFRTTYPLWVEPVSIVAAEWESGGGRERTLRLDFLLNGITPNTWQGDRLRLYLGDTFADALKLFLLLTRHVREISVFAASGGESLILPAAALNMAGFLPESVVLPYPDNAFPGFRLLQEYFALPEKYLFLELTGLSSWRGRGNSIHFSVRFRFHSLPEWTPDVRASSFLLNVTPAINLFEQDAHPIRLDHRQPEYRVRPAGNFPHLRVFTVDSVIGYRQNGQDIRYVPFTWFRSDTPGYSLRYRPSPLKNDVDCLLSIPYRSGQSLEEQTLSVRLTCTDGSLPEGLKIGDIREPSDTSPERFSFRNLRPVTPYQTPPLNESLLWRITSHLSGNFMSIGSVEQLRNLLSLYLASTRSDSKGDLANRQRIEGIESVDISRERRLIRGLPIEGSHVHITCHNEHFINLGGLYLFGCVLEKFLAGYASLNTFTECSITDSLSGGTFTWPARIGQNTLL